MTEREIKRIPTRIVSFKPWLRSDSNYVVFGGKASVYALIPADMRDELKKLGIDVTTKTDESGIKVECLLVTGTDDGRPRLVFDFIPPVTSEIMKEMRTKAEGR